MREKKPLLGFCPVGKFVFSNEDAVKFKKLLSAKLEEWQVRFVDLEGVLEDGLVKDQKHVEPVVEHFIKAGVDCLFVPHSNFGTEGAVGMISQKAGSTDVVMGTEGRGAFAGWPATSRHALRAVCFQ